MSTACGGDDSSAGAGDAGVAGSAGTTGIGGGAGSSSVGGAAGSGGSSPLTINDPLYTTATSTVAEWITPDAYTCKTEESACGLPCPADGLWVAINSTDFRKSATCSACMEVTGPLGTVTVEVIENCAGACKDGEIELSREAFEKIGNAADGHAPVTWKLVPCHRTGPIAFSYEKDSDEWWAGIQVRNPALPVNALSIRYSATVGWVPLSLDGWDHFPVSADLGSGPFDFRVTAIDGQELLEEGIAYVPGGVVQGKGQFKF
ncbi:MAG: hypothetical protein HY898_06445 [Deltaproteobacteria bacterium]|nr:hypothetical protein [Deltaproteobacteria bacterium]